MNKITYILFALCILLSACKEISPDYRLIRPQDSDRSVLIEEFTGVQCVNCPQGTDEIVNLQSIYGHNLISVAVHAGFFAQAPYSDSKYNFLTQQGTAIENWIGPPQGYPSAVINRSKFSGENSYQLPRPKWAAYVADLTSSAPLVNVIVNTTFNETSRELKVSVTSEALDDVDFETRVNVMLTEDNIIDPQANTAAPGGKTSDYRHRHVLRTMLTNFDGNFLAANMKFGDKITREYTYTLPAENGWWNADNCHIVAFVTEAASNAPGPVLNVTEVSIVK